MGDAASEARGEKVDAGFSQIARVFKGSRDCCDLIESQQALAPRWEANNWRARAPGVGYSLALIASGGRRGSTFCGRSGPLSLSSLALFAGVYLAATATPGPGVAALVARVLGRGLWGIAPFIAGFVVGDLIWFA